jgi:hypothetical protein
MHNWDKYTKVTPFKCFEKNSQDVRLRISTNQVLKTAEVDIDTIVSSQDASLDIIPISFNNAANTNYGKDSQCLIYYKFFRGTNGLKHHTRIMHGSNLNGSNLNPSVDFSDPSTIVGLISKLRTSTPILNRIPKGARIAVADELSNILISCINDNSLVKWLRLLIFPYCVLRVPEKSLKKTQSLSSAVKINLEFWKRNKDLSSQSLFIIYLSKSKQTKIDKKNPRN